MEKKEYIKTFLAGLFFIAGILLFFLVVFTFSKGRGFATKKFEIVVLYRNVGGLMEGAPIRLSGVNVGTVSKINFLEEEMNGRRVTVTLNVFDKFRKQLEGKRANFPINTEGILGEKLIEISINPKGQLITLNQPVIGQDPLDVQDLAETFSAAAKAFTVTSRELGNIDINELSDIVGETARALATTSEGVNFILEEMRYLTRKSKRILNRLEHKLIEGNLFKVF